MDLDVQGVTAFLEEQKLRQVRHFPTVESEKVLTFMGTTSLPGSYCTVAVHAVRRFESVNGARELHVHLRGELVRPPKVGECVTVHVTSPEQYQGYQVKSRTMSARTAEGALAAAEEGGCVVKGSHIFTVHHSPYTMKFFEQIPIEEVQQIVGKVRCAFVGIGETANISPRFVYHWEELGGRLALYHGDGLALKTYMNLKSNKQETRIVVDLDTFQGYALEGTIEEFQPHQQPEAYDKIVRGFAAGNWGRPSRTFRFVAERSRRIAPQS